VNLDIATAPKRDSRHWIQTEITWSDILRWVDTPANVKEAGNYLLGRIAETTATHPPSTTPCTNLHRRKDAIKDRCVLCLDVDHPDVGFAEHVLATLGHQALLHTTFTSSPDAPRYRLLIPLDRRLLPDEYIIAARSLMQRLGEHQFDPGSSQPERYMFLPAAQHAGWFESWSLEGPVISSAMLLEEFEEDLSNKPMPKPHRNKRDPFEIDGVIGAFNRSYQDIDVLIEEYELPYVAAGGDRWHLSGARSAAGMGQVSPGLFFSHHIGDPAAGKTCSAFDLVRLHRFGDLDDGCTPQTPINRLPSNTAMLDVASTDPRVTAELVGVDFEASMDDVASDNDWRIGLKLAKRTGKFVDIISNWDLLTTHDPVFRGLFYNELSLSIETATDLPWRPIDRSGATFSDVDRTALCHHIEREYGIRPSRPHVDGLVTTVAQKRHVNPIRSYLEDLSWDGTPRVETCLPGVTPTPYTRLVARKVMAAAVARVLDPGCKWDHTLILHGTQGLGKSHWVERVARGYSASLGPIDNKDTLLALQRSWIMVSDEGHSLRKSEADAQKEFLTRTGDVFRLPYERETIRHPRHCVIWGTTNDDAFLRRQEGNRRFLVVRCEGKVDFDSLTDAYVDQLWAEAVVMYHAGERLFLEDDELGLATTAQEDYLEEDSLIGLIQEYLETRVPEDWDDMSPETRRIWRQNQEDALAAPGTEQITRTCSAQLWVEAFGRRIGEHKRNDLTQITDALRSIPGWSPAPGRHRIPGYGPQLIFVRDPL
jgi:putative DNA primase/helicase